VRDETAYLYPINNQPENKENVTLIDSLRTTGSYSAIANYPKTGKFVTPFVGVLLWNT
jgi:hypothetical protein